MLAAFGALFIIGLAGGALGNEFGGGFLGAPIAHLQIAAENITSEANVGSFHITNTMVTTWAAIDIVLALGFVASRRAKLVPTGWQNAFEVIIEYFQRIGEGLAGKRGLTYVPLALTIFLFILIFFFLVWRCIVF